MRRIQHTSLVAIILLSAQQLFALDIIPYPLRVETKSGSFNLNHSSGILYIGNCQKEAAFLKAVLEKENHGSLPAEPFSASTFENPIICTVNAKQNEGMGSEGYDLTVSVDKVQINAASPA